MHQPQPVQRSVSMAGRALRAVMWGSVRPACPPCKARGTVPPMTEETITRHLLITGHVQGVSYRWSMVQAAERLGVQGWVRNRSDGRVEACAWGSPQAVQALVDWAQQGPAQARVDRVVVGNVPDGGEAPQGFTQRETV